MTDSLPTRIVLTGFMGSGKSTVGRRLAVRLGYSFVDTDELIEERHGPIPELFADQGEEGFRRIERGVAEELAQVDEVVIATGGRLMLDEENAATLGAAASVVCLAATADDVLARVGHGQALADRPLLAGSDPYRRIVELLEERRLGYAQFPQVATSGRSPDEIVDEIIRRLSEPGRPTDRS